MIFIHQTILVVMYLFILHSRNWKFSHIYMKLTLVTMKLCYYCKDMVGYNLQHEVFILKECYQNGTSAVTAQKERSNKNTILTSGETVWIKRIIDQQIGHAGWPSIHLEEVRQTLLKSPQKSLWHLSQQRQMCYTG